MSTLRLLTPREHEVAALVAVGFSNKHIARQLQMAEGTVKVHLHNIFEKLGISNRTTLAALMLGVQKDYAETREYAE